MKSNGKKPLISVLMPIYNGSPYMNEAINSILNQTYRNFELLIADDGSTDDSWKIIQSYKRRFPNIIKVFRLGRNSGAFNATNFLIKYARGKYLAPMDCDDIAYPDRLSRQVKFLQDFPEVIVLGSQANIINEKGQFVGIKKMPLNHNDIYKEFGVFHPMVHPSCMIRKGVINGSNKLYKIKYGVNDDYYTFFSFLAKGKFANLSETLLSYRIHFKNSSLTNVKGKFLNSLKIRLEAANRFGYKFSPISLVLMIIQTMVVLPIPSKYVLYLYLLAKGIYTPKLLFLMLKENLSYLFVRIAKSQYNYLRSLL